MSWSEIVGNVGNNQYQERIQRLNSNGILTAEIELTVEGAIANLKKGAKSFVIFGEPQSGKTEMMIALNARLLDEGYDVVINLLTDNQADRTKINKLIYDLLGTRGHYIGVSDRWRGSDTPFRRTSSVSRSFRNLKAS